MITGIITFGIPDGMTREDVVANYRRSAPSWRVNPDLIRKNYLYAAESRCAGGVYLWRSMEAARGARNAAWLERVRAATQISLEPYADWIDSERVVMNVAALYREYGAAEKPNSMALWADMQRFHQAGALQLPSPRPAEGPDGRLKPVRALRAHGTTRRLTHRNRWFSRTRPSPRTYWQNKVF